MQKTQSKRVLKWERYNNKRTSGWKTKFYDKTICIPDDVDFGFIFDKTLWDINSLPEVLNIIENHYIGRCNHG